MPKYPVLTEGKHAGEHVLSDEDANGHRSREVVTIASGSDLDPGTVLGKVTASGKYKILTPGASDGSEAAAAVLFADAKAASADVKAVVHVREAVMNASLLVWPAGIVTNDKNAAIAALAGKQIILR